MALLARLSARWVPTAYRRGPLWTKARGCFGRFSSSLARAPAYAAKMHARVRRRFVARQAHQAALRFCRHDEVPASAVPTLGRRAGRSLLTVGVRSAGQARCERWASSWPYWLA
jgi:hypothetical protein